MLEYLQNITSLDARRFVSYMNHIDWSQSGVFATLLSTVGRHVMEKGDRMANQKWDPTVVPALSLLIFEL